MQYLAFLGKHNHFVFIGDSRIRQLYMAFLNHLDPHEDTTATIPPDRHRSDLVFGDSKLCLRVEFIWSPYVSKHMINDFQNWKVRKILYHLVQFSDTECNKIVHMHDAIDLEIGFHKLIGSLLNTLCSTLFCLRNCGLYGTCVVKVLCTPAYNSNMYSDINGLYSYHSHKDLVNVDN